MLIKASCCQDTCVLSTAICTSTAQILGAHQSKKQLEALLQMQGPSRVTHSIWEAGIGSRNLLLMPALPPLWDLPLSQTLVSTPSSAPGQHQKKGKCSQNRLTTSPVSGADTSSLEVLSTALSCSWLQILKVWPVLVGSSSPLPQKWEATTEVTKRHTRGLKKKKKPLSSPSRDLGGREQWEEREWDEMSWASLFWLYREVVSW